MNINRFLALSMAIALTLTATLAGCGGSPAPATSPSAAVPGGTESTAPGQPIEIEIVTGTTVTLPEQNFINEALGKALGVTINFNILGAGDDYATALNTRIAGGDVPDIFQIPSKAADSFYQYINNSVVMSLSPYLDQLGPVVQWVGGEDGLTPNMYNGELYAVPKKWRTSYHSWLLRQDWLDKLKLTSPTTLEEGLEVAKAMTFNDPDGNGKNDTYGFTFYGLNGFDAILNPYDGSVSNSIIIRDGKVTSSLLQPNMKAGLEMCKKYVDAGVVDPDMVANTFEGLQDKITQGQIGMGTFEWTIYKKANMDNIKSVSPEADWQFISPLASGTGDPVVYDRVDVTNVRGDFVVGAHIKQDEAKLKKVIELLNYIVSEEGMRLLSYGIEGRHYNMEGGKVVPTPLMAEECNFLYAYQLCFRDDLEYLMVKFPEAVKEVTFIYGIDRYEIYNAAVELPEGFYKVDMDKYIQDNMIKFIYGQRPISEYDAFIEELNKTFRFDEYITIAEEQLKAKGYV